MKSGPYNSVRDEVKGQASLVDLALLFLKLGTFGFGGPAAHIAMMEDEVVRRRKWLSKQELLDLIGLTNLIPGPNSTELAIHIGLNRAGTAGFLIAGLCFVLPAALITFFLAYLYVEYGSLPGVQPWLDGVKPVVVAIIAAAIIRLAGTAFKRFEFGLIGLVAAAAVFAGLNEIAVLFVCAIAGAAGIQFSVRRFKIPMNPGSACLLPISFLPQKYYLQLAFAFSAVPHHASSATLSGIFLFFLKIGSILYGSGYVLIAFLQGELVDRLGWISQSQLLDAIAVGQVTPGPLFSTATFIGHILGGWQGAALATLGMFLPSFVFVLALARILPKIGKHPLSRLLLDAVNASALGLMAAAAIQIGLVSVISIWQYILLLAAIVASAKYKLNPAVIVTIGAVAGWLASFIGR